MPQTFPWDIQSPDSVPVTEDEIKLIQTTFGVDMSDFLGEIIDTEIILHQKTTSTFPIRLYEELSGLPRQIFEFIQSSSMIKQPMLALPAALCAAGAIQGHRIRSELDTRTNLYCLGLAPSGAGKDHARRAITKMFWQSGQQKMVIGDPKSGSGLKRGIKDNKGRALLMWDEIGRALKQIGSWKAGTHEKNILEVMMKIFTSSSTYMPPDSLANRDNKAPTEGIEQPCFCMYGTSVPENFYDSMSGQDVVDGFLARILAFESTDYVITRRQKIPVLETPKDLVEEVQRWESMSNNIANGGNVDMGINPLTVVATPNARKKLDDYDYDSRSRGFNTVYAPLWMRAAEHAEKLALIVSNGDTIIEKNAQFGIDLAQYCINYMEHTIKDRVSSSDTETQLKRIKRWLEKKGSVIYHRDFTRAFQDMPGKTRNDLINTLLDSGIIENDSESGKRKFRVIRED